VAKELSARAAAGIMPAHRSFACANNSSALLAPLGTRMVNDWVPLPVIQRVLDHASITMTARYAHLDEEAVKREIIGFHERVNIRGERIALPVGGPLGEAADEGSHRSCQADAVFNTR